jgi:hypothetical protein
MRRTRVADRVFLVRFDTQYALASTFLRFQEHYESPRFRNRVFSLEQFMDWYAARHGAFTYYQDWAGFNVPSSTFDAFRAGRFNPLLEKERRLLKMFEGEREPFYVIGTSSDAELKHELAHGFYFTRPAYRREVRAAIRGHDTSALERRLRAMGYHRAVVADEVQAYLVSGTRDVPTRALAPLRRQVQAIYRRHAADAAR